MKHFEYAPNNLAAGMILLLAVIFITTCGSPDAPSPPPAELAANPEPSHTPTPAPTSTAASPSRPQTPTIPSPSPDISTSSTVRSLNQAGEPVLKETQKSNPPQPTQRPTKLPTATPASINKNNSVSASVDVYETTVPLPTYPFKEYLVEQIDPVYNIPVFYFNRAEYEAAGPVPTFENYTGVVLENPYLRLTFIPELGGRLYSAIIKATDQEIFYQNRVVKPSRYGVLQPYEANWWLAAGGMEWAYPTQEHGYRFGVPWDYRITQNPTGVTITLSDTAPDRVGLNVSVTLPADSSVFTVSPKVINNGPQSVPVQLWTNAALALSPGSMSPNTEFIVPTDVITVHSRGEFGWTVPDARLEAPWPQVGDTDLRDYRQWANYLGFFVSNQEAPFIGAHNPTTDLGIVRLAAPHITSGSGKLFAFGNDFPDRSYTDDNSQYFEIWGGANTGFWSENDIWVPVGQTLGLVESWWPIAGLGGVTWATHQTAIYLRQIDDQYTLSAIVSRPLEGKVRISTGDVSILSDSFAADPVTSLTWHFAIMDEPIVIRFTDKGGMELLEYRVE